MDDVIQIEGLTCLRKCLVVRLQDFPCSTIAHSHRHEAHEFSIVLLLRKSLPLALAVTDVQWIIIS